MKLDQPNFIIQDIDSYIKDLFENGSKDLIFSRECKTNGTIIESSARHDYLQKVCDDLECESCNAIRKYGN